jgi:hypothetical protein
MSFLGSLFGADDLQKEGAALDAQLAALNERDYGPGGRYYNAGNYEVIKQNLETGATGNVDSQINEAFFEGLQEGKNNITGAVGGTFDLFGGGLGAILKGIPWYVWAGVFLYFAWPFIGARLARAQ